MKNKFRTAITAFIAFCFIILSLPSIAALPDISDSMDISDSRAFLSNYIQSVYNSAGGFPADDANAALQTSDGYMWFATYSGLIRYDGKKFTTYSAANDDGFNSSSVRALYEDREGALWIGTNDKGLVRYEKGSFTYYDKEAGAPSNIIRAVTENSEGTIICGTAEGIFTLTLNENNPADYKINVLSSYACNAAYFAEYSAAPFVVSVCCDSRGNIYAVFNNGELYVMTPDGISVRLEHDKRFYTVYCTDSGKIIAGTQDASVVFAEFDGGFFEYYSYETELKNINTVYEDSKGRIWIGAETGLGFFDSNNPVRFTKLTDTLVSGFISGICEDYENGFWITSDENGILKLTLSAFTDENVICGIPPTAVNAILKQNGLVYAATNNGLLIFDQSKNAVYNDITEALDNIRIRDIYRDSAGYIWFCTYAEKGVIRYNPENGDIVSIKDELNSEKTRRIYELKNGCFALATANGVNFIKDCEIITAQEALGCAPDFNIRLPENMVLDFFEADDGTLFIATDGNGLYAVKNGETIIYDEENGLSGSVIMRIVNDVKRKGIWVSAGAGLCFIDNNREVRHIAKLPAYSVFDVLINENELWLLTASAILRTDANELLDEQTPLRYTEIGRSSGLTSSINANSRKYLDENKRLYICCESGVISISLYESMTEKIPYAAVNKVDADGMVFQNYEEEIVIPENTSRLTFNLSLLSFGFSGGTAMRYMLEGQDKEETVINCSDNCPDEISYTNLSGGSYTFTLSSVDSNGYAGNSVVIKIKKLPGVFEHVYMKILLVLTAVVAVALIIFNMAKNINKSSLKKQNEYRKIITQAISAIANAIDAKDAYTKGHSARVAAYSAGIARRMGYGKDFIENIYYIGLLHDVGKIGIPSSIINKPDKLTDEEYGIMKTHPKRGMEILKDITTIKNISLGAAEHHERWDGGGYYLGLKGEDISIEGRIISAADSYDAMSSDRAYRKALPKNVILSEFIRGSGSQFDPAIAEIAAEMINQDVFEVLDINNIIDFDK